MAFERIPMPKSGIEAFDQGLSSAQSIFDSIMKNRLTGAEAYKAQKQADLPFAGVSVPGPAGQIAGLEMVKHVYGENSPQYKQAQKAFDVSQNSANARIGYQQALTGSLPLRYTTPEGRQIIERSNLHQGYSPSGTPQGQVIAPGAAPYHEPGKPNFQTPGVPQDEIINGLPGQHGAPAQQQGMPQQQQGAPSVQSQIPPTQNGMPSAEESYNLRQTKSDLPASVMQKNLYANNIDKTLDSINLKDLTYYNGPMGAAELKRQEALDAFGKSSKAYQKYKEATGKFDFLSRQVRQFYGDSIQPSAMEALQSKLDPRGWAKNDKTSIKRFEAQKHLLKQELQTYRDASKNASVYTGQQGGQSNQALEDPFGIR